MKAGLYAFVRFPRGCAPNAVSFDADNKCTELLRYDIELPTNISAMELDLLNDLVDYKRSVNTDSKVSLLQQRTAMYQNILVRVLHSVVDAHLKDTPSFKLTDRIFDELASNWMQMKLQVRTAEENKAQQFRFKPRAFKIDNIIEIDISTVGSSSSNESFLEWKEFHSRQESSDKETDEEPEAVKDDCDYIELSSLNDMIHVHNELFGSTDLCQSPGYYQVSDASRLSSFTDSYSLGTKMIKDMEGLISSFLDAKIAPEHLLRLCLEHGTKFCAPNKSALAYNFYKEPNFSMLAKMVDPLSSLKQRITLFFKERDEHPALRRILDIIEMILAMPLSTPLAKALSSLEFLLSRVRMLQETVEKFPLSEHLDPIFALVSSWYKLEFESCPALLDEVEDQFEKNAGKLWFIEMSSIGEFRKRLQLLLAFHGHISTGIRNGTYSSLCLEESVKILYNTFGFYAQFLPIILEHIGTKRRKIEEEVHELVKLCRWERFEDYLSIERSRKTRQKLKKIMQKYTDLLQQPVMLFINKEATQSGINPQSNDKPSLLVDSFERSRDLLDIVRK